MRIITIAAHTGFYKNDSTFSVRATTIARMATSSNALQMAAGGLLPLVVMCTVTT